MDGKMDFKKAERINRSIAWATLFLSIGLLLVMALAYLSSQTGKDSFSTLAPLLMIMLAGSLQGLATNIRWKFVFLAFQLLFLFFAIRSLMHSANS